MYEDLDFFTAGINHILGIDSLHQHSSGKTLV
jgi:hypothetical protein